MTWTEEEEKIIIDAVAEWVKKNRSRDAEDIGQEALLSLLQTKNPLPADIKRLKYFVFSVCNNKRVDAYINRVGKGKTKRPQPISINTTISTHGADTCEMSDFLLRGKRDRVEVDYQLREDLGAAIKRERIPHYRKLLEAYLNPANDCAADIAAETGLTVSGVNWHMCRLRKRYRTKGSFLLRNGYGGNCKKTVAKQKKESDK